MTALATALDAARRRWPQHAAPPAPPGTLVAGRGGDGTCRVSALYPDAPPLVLASAPSAAELLRAVEGGAP